MGNRQKVPPLPFLLSSLITSRPPRKVWLGCASRTHCRGAHALFAPACTQAYVEDEAYLQEEADAAQEAPEEESKQVRARALVCISRLAAELSAPGFVQVSIPAPDPALPPSFDSDNSGHHYRFLESANQARAACACTACAFRALSSDASPHAAQWMVRPIVDAHGWDHESGIEGFSVDKAFIVKKTIPANVSGQVCRGLRIMLLHA